VVRRLSHNDWMLAEVFWNVGLFVVA
jgi:hypothetical protein